MRLLAAIVLAALLTVPAEAGDPAGAARRRDWVGSELFIEVPLNYSTDVIFPFGGSHHTLPGTVTINRAPYYCEPHHKPFTDRTSFIAHLRTKHGLDDRDITAAVLVDRGQQVRYVGK